MYVCVYVCMSVYVYERDASLYCCVNKVNSRSENSLALFHGNQGRNINQANYYNAPRVGHVLRPVTSWQHCGGGGGGG